MMLWVLSESVEEQLFSSLFFLLAYLRWLVILSIFSRNQFFVSLIYSRHSLTDMATGQCDPGNAFITGGVRLTIISKTTFCSQCFLMFSLIWASDTLLFLYSSACSARSGFLAMWSSFFRSLGVAIFCSSLPLFPSLTLFGCHISAHAVAWRKTTPQVNLHFCSHSWCRRLAAPLHVRPLPPDILPQTSSPQIFFPDHPLPVTSLWSSL